MTEEVCGSITVENGHLAIHEDDMRRRMIGAGLLQEVVQSLLPVPN